jgi:hypothetical protein
MLDKATCVRCCDWDWDEEQGELLYVFLQDLDAVLGGLAINVITTGRVALVLYRYNEGNYSIAGPVRLGWTMDQSMLGKTGAMGLIRGSSVSYS